MWMHNPFDEWLAAHLPLDGERSPLPAIWVSIHVIGGLCARPQDMKQARKEGGSFLGPK